MFPPASELHDAPAACTDPTPGTARLHRQTVDVLNLTDPVLESSLVVMPPTEPLFCRFISFCCFWHLLFFCRSRRFFSFWAFHCWPRVDLHETRNLNWRPAGQLWPFQTFHQVSWDKILNLRQNLSDWNSVQAYRSSWTSLKNRNWIVCFDFEEWRIQLVFFFFFNGANQIC